jgi:hypothetical protein
MRVLAIETPIRFIAAARVLVLITRSGRSFVGSAGPIVFVVIHLRVRGHRLAGGNGLVMMRLRLAVDLPQRLTRAGERSFVARRVMLRLLVGGAGLFCGVARAFLLIVVVIGSHRLRQRQGKSYGK